jgi:hypothetical protein
MIKRRWWVGREKRRRKRERKEINDEIQVR